MQSTESADISVVVLDMIKIISSSCIVFFHSICNHTGVFKLCDK